MASSTWLSMVLRHSKSKLLLSAESKTSRFDLVLIWTGCFGMWFNYVRWLQQAIFLFLHLMDSSRSPRSHHLKVSSIQFRKFHSPLSPSVQLIRLAKKQPWTMHSNCKLKTEKIYNFWCLYFILRHEKPHWIKTLEFSFFFFNKMFVSKLFPIWRSKRTKNHTVDWLFRNIRFLGHVFDFNSEYFDQYIEFQDLLDIIDVNNVTHLYDTQDKFEFKVICSLKNHKNRIISMRYNFGS